MNENVEKRKKVVRNCQNVIKICNKVYESQKKPVIASRNFEKFVRKLKADVLILQEVTILLHTHFKKTLKR